MSIICYLNNDLVLGDRVLLSALLFVIHLSDCYLSLQTNQRQHNTSHIMQTTWKIWILPAILTVLLAFFYSKDTEGADSQPKVKRQPLQRTYSCGPCALPDCRCPSMSIPGGLALQDTPQFIMLTFDDAVTTTTFPVSKAVRTPIIHIKEESRED